MQLSQKTQLIFAVIFQVFSIAASEEYRVEITSDGPIIRGGTLNFTAVLYRGGNLATGSFVYEWEDDALPSHSFKVTSGVPVVSWNVRYGDRYPPGPYEVQVTVKKLYFFIPYEVTSGRYRFNLSDTLNGKLLLTQKNSTRDTQYISTKEPLLHSIELTKPDAKYVSNATTITTFWFIDCIYYGPTNNGRFSHTFPVSGEEHTVDALMVADFNPPPPPTTTTTTTTVKPTTTTTTTPTTTTTTTPTTKTTTHTTSKTSLKPSLINVTTTSPISHVSLNLTSESNSKVLRKRSADTPGKIQKIMTNVNGTLVPLNASFPYVCNGTVSVDEKKSYGYFSRKIVAKAPISDLNVTGNNWLQHGDMLILHVLCDGSPSLRYCVDFIRGSYNVTGNETCEEFLTLESCSFLIQRYLGEPVEHTVVIIMENDVTKLVKSVAVTVYKVKKQAQLSVIVVPVAFSLVAVVLIVFGVAYYIQNRRRFIVEVADFNFGVDYTDLQYKTFKDRLKESFVNAFTRAPSPELSEPPNWPPGHSQKYGSMT